MYVDMTSNTAVGRVVEATFKLAGAYKFSNTKATLLTTNGYTIELDQAAQSGTIAMGGSTYAVHNDEPDSSSGRRLETTGEMAETMSGRQLAEHHLERRRKLSDRRQAGYYSGALMTSGSFTMMASGGLF